MARPRARRLVRATIAFAAAAASDGPPQTPAAGRPRRRPVALASSSNASGVSSDPVQHGSSSSKKKEETAPTVPPPHVDDAPSSDDEAVVNPAKGGVPRRPSAAPTSARPSPEPSLGGGDPRPRPSAPPTPARREDAHEKEPPQCPLRLVPRKALSACLLSGGSCVASRAECADLGGRYEASGCALDASSAGGDASPSGYSCACCTDLPTDAPTPRPTATFAPTARYAQAACRLEDVPRLALLSCFEQRDGVCVSTRDECDEAGGRFELAGCDADARCACCAGVPTAAPVGGPTTTTTRDEKGFVRSDVSNEADDGEVFERDDPSAAPTVVFAGGFQQQQQQQQHDPSSSSPTPAAASEADLWWARQKDDDVVDARRNPSAAPTGLWTEDRRSARIAPPDSRSRVVGAVVRFASIAVLVALATVLVPQPSNPIVRAVLAPFRLLLLVLRAVALWLLSFCCTFGEGIADSRPPAPLSSGAGDVFAAMPVGSSDVQMTDRRRSHGGSSSLFQAAAGTAGKDGATDSLLADTEDFSLDDSDDDDEEAHFVGGGAALGGHRRGGAADLYRQINDGAERKVA